MGLSRFLIKLAGGPGSGNFGHAGIPGQHGGSAPKNSGQRSGWVLRTKDPFGTREWVPEQGIPEKIDKIIKDIRKSVDIGNPEIIIGEVSSAMGQSTKSRERTYVTLINPVAIRKTLEDKTLSDKVFEDWFAGTKRNFDSALEHVVAHELGHKWYKENKLSIDQKWRDFYKQNVGAMSGYARYYNDPVEGFTDSFARFTTGKNMDPVVEDFFMENVR